MLLKSALHYLAILIFLFAPFCSQAQGPVNALQLDGQDDHLLLGQNNRGVTDEITVTAWIKTGSKKQQVIVSKYDAQSQRGYQLQMKDGRVEFFGNDGIFRTSGYSPVIINDNLWHHVAGVAEKGTWTLYIDGTLMGVATQTFNPSANLENVSPLTIGKHASKNVDYFHGTIDEIRVWNKASDDNKLLENMCQKLPQSSPNLVAYFKLDEGSGNTVKDNSALNITGSLTNMNVATARIVSGAPVGDKSTYTKAYSGKWSLSLKGVGEATFSIDTVEAYAKVLHLYYVNNKPNYTNGLPQPIQNHYFGVFTSRSPEVKHTLSFTFAQAVCSTSLFTRTDNADQQWTKLSEMSKDNVSFSAVSASGRGEYTYSTSAIGEDALNLPSIFFACAGKSVVINATLAGATYAWSNGKTTPIIEVTSPANLSLNITFEGCTSTKYITVSDDECPIIPNIITPNGDGKNDTFVLQGINLDAMSIEIFNRWGTSVFKRDAYDNSWAGAESGIYYYHITSCQTQKVYKGWVEVIL